MRPLLLLASLLAACSGPMRADGGAPDAGVDAGAQLDGGRDGGLDGGGPLDAGTDAGELDAGTDAGPVRVVKLSGHCALRSDGEVRCWGPSALGHNEPTGSDSAVRAMLSAPATDIGCEGGHCCAIVAGGEVWCWGTNTSGQCGIDSSAGPFLRPARAVFDGVATMVATGSSSSCVIDDRGELYCWGRPFVGGEDSNRWHEPVHVPVFDGGPALQLVVGLNGACTIADHSDGDRSAFCLAAGEAGALFERECDEVMLAGGSRYCTRDGELYCWGVPSGECWDGSTRTATSPPMLDYSGVAHLGGGCALYPSGEIDCGAGRRDTGRPGAFDVGRAPEALTGPCVTDGTGVYCNGTPIVGIFD